MQFERQQEARRDGRRDAGHASKISAARVKSLQEQVAAPSEVQAADADADAAQAEVDALSP